MNRPRLLSGCGHWPDRAVAGFALWQGGFELLAGDVLLVLAAISAGMGYTAGGQLSKTLGGWQAICWALLLALPLTLPFHGVVRKRPYGR